MTPEQLKERLGDPQIVIIDARSTRSWDPSEHKIPGAVREDPGNVHAWAGRYPKEKTLVVYCA